MPRRGSRSGMAAPAVKLSSKPLPPIATPVCWIAGVTPPETSMGRIDGSPEARLILNSRPKES